MPETGKATRYRIEILAPVGSDGRMTHDTYTTGAGYIVDHHPGRVLVKLDGGRDDKDRPVLSASYGGGIRTIVRPTEEKP